MLLNSHLLVLIIFSIMSTVSDLQKVLSVLKSVEYLQIYNNSWITSNLSIALSEK
jgi:hypothetical protein